MQSRSRAACRRRRSSCAPRRNRVSFSLSLRALSHVGAGLSLVRAGCRLTGCDCVPFSQVTRSLVTICGNGQCSASQATYNPVSSPAVEGPVLVVVPASACSIAVRKCEDPLACRLALSLPPPRPPPDSPVLPRVHRTALSASSSRSRAAATLRPGSRLSPPPRLSGRLQSCRSRACTASGRRQTWSQTCSASAPPASSS